MDEEMSVVITEEGGGSPTPTSSTAVQNQYRTGEVEKHHLINKCFSVEFTWDLVLIQEKDYYANIILLTLSSVSIHIPVG